MKGTDGIWPFLNFIDTNINEGYQHDTGGVLGGRATHLVRCGEFCRCLEFCPKYIYLDSDLIIYYFDHFIMYDCLFALVLFKNYVETIMFKLDAVLRWKNLFRYNAHKAANILVISCFLYTC